MPENTTYQLIGTLVKTVDIQRLRRELDKVKTVFKKEVNEIRSYYPYFNYILLACRTLCVSSLYMCRHHLVDE